MKYLIMILISVSLIAFAFTGCAPSSTNSMTTTTTSPSETMGTITVAPSANMTTTSTAKYKDLTPAQAKELIEKTPDLIIVDVSPRYNEGHLPGAVNYYVGDGTLDKVIPTLDKSKPYLVYCHVDSVSILGAQKLIDAGFTTVYRLEGNYAAWVAAGYSVEK